MRKSWRKKVGGRENVIEKNWGKERKGSGLLLRSDVEGYGLGAT
jgi:hypothetical protein